MKEFACRIKDHSCDQGTGTDAKDGELSGNPAAWGSPESTIGISLDVAAGETATAYYWVAVGTRYSEVAALNQVVSEKTPAELIRHTSNYWSAWIQKEPRSFGDLPAAVTELFHRSLLILRTQIDNRGAIIAANDSDIVRFGKDTYSYMWGRDGAFVAAALAQAGYDDVCKRFFTFCAEALSDDGYLMQHYNPDGIRLAGDSSTNTGRNSRNGLGTLEVPNGNGAVNCIGSIGASPLRVTIPAWVGRS